MNSTLAAQARVSASSTTTFEREQRSCLVVGLSSGDPAVIDADGFLTIVGRKKEIIIRGGLNVAPREVEDLILKLPGVKAAAVIGLPHERLGEIDAPA